MKHSVAHNPIRGTVAACWLARMMISLLLHNLAKTRTRRRRRRRKFCNYSALDDDNGHIDEGTRNDDS